MGMIGRRSSRDAPHIRCSRCTRKFHFDAEEPVSVPLISQMCNELKRLLHETYTGPIASLV
jgi:hypothetical protein